MKQQDILDAFYNKVIDIIGDDIGNRLYDNIGIDNKQLPLAVFYVIADLDEYLLGDGQINNSNIQVSFFGKKTEGIRTLRTISDKLVEGILGEKLSNDMLVKVTNKGTVIISDVADETVQIITEFNIR